jgi:hypothetical protein
MVYKGYVDDVFHYMDERARYDHGSFRTADEAIAACRRIVGSDLADYAKQNSGITAAQLYELYVMFAHDPFIVPTEGAELPEFHARQYARTHQCRTTLTR